MKQKIIDNWDTIMNLLETNYDMSRVIVDTWIKTLTVYKVEGKTVYMYVQPSRGKHGVEYIKSKGYDMYLISAIMEVLGTTELEIVIDEKENVGDQNSSQGTMGAGYDDGAEVDINGNENFVVGDSNKMAYVTCTAVADLPGQSHLNPLFLYGDSGVGKTHLIQSVAHYILQHSPQLKVLYVPAEIFVNDIVTSIAQRTTETVKEKYRTVDVLIIDDIQEIIGKEATQTEFFNTFNVLHSAGKQIILSSDKPPSEMKTLEDRLRSRFEWGVPIDIHEPDYETRMAILKNKAEKKKLNDIPDDVFVYIAENIVTNVRELESALNTLYVYRSLDNKEVTLELAQTILRDLMSKDAKQEITPDVIMSVVGEHLGVSVDDIKSKKRTQSIAQARQISMYLCRALTDKGLKDIGEALGGKDHSTVINGIKRVEEKMKVDAEFDAQLDIIKKKIGV